jgi:hypothetical protein
MSISPRMFKPATDPKSRPSDLLAELQVAKEALRKHDSEFRDEQIDLEKSGALDVAVAETDTPQTRKQHWLNGYAANAPVSSNSRLHDIRLDRAGIALAIDDLERQIFHAMADHWHEWYSENQKHWLVIQKRRARALLELRASNAAAAKFRNEAAGKSPGPVSLPGDRISGVFGPPISGDAIYRFLEEAVQAGIIDRKDLSNE